MKMFVAMAVVLLGTANASIVSPSPTGTSTPQETPTLIAAPTDTPPADSDTPSPTSTPSSGGLPDLIPDVPDWTIQLNTTVSSGDVAEGCASTTSGIDLLRFSVRTRNIGTADLVLGDPMCPSPCSDHPLAVCGNPDFMCSPASGHDHPHFEDFALYELLDADGNVVVVSHKEGFCVRDEACSNATFTCSNQGLSVGCSDIYGSDLGCQYLEITGIPSGDYTVRVTVDPSNRIEELDETNNMVLVSVTIPNRPEGSPTATPSDSSPTPTTTPTAETEPDTPTPQPSDTPTPVPSPVCAGDCNGNGNVTIDEIVTLVHIALGDMAIDVCPAGDNDQDGAITVNDILAAVQSTLAGCP